jgi:hypothetical protein
MAHKKEDAVPGHWALGYGLIANRIMSTTITILLEG